MIDFKWILCDYFRLNDTATHEVYTEGHTLARTDVLAFSASIPTSIPMFQKATRAGCACAPPWVLAKAPKTASVNWPMQASTSSSSIRLMATRQGLSKGCAGSRKTTDRKSTRLNSSH